MSNIRKIITYPNACVIKSNNKRVIVENYKDNFAITIENHGEKWNGEKGSASWKYLGRNTVINHIYLTPETAYEVYIALGKQLKLSHLNEA
jgi:hypothetical protein